MAKQKINFRGKEMNLLEAKLKLFSLRAHLISVDLDNEEKRDYQSQEKSRKKSFWKPSTEREYIIQKLDSIIGLAEVAENDETCRKYGHKRRIKIPFIPRKEDPQKIYCARCGTYYSTGAYGQEI